MALTTTWSSSTRGTHEASHNGYSLRATRSQDKTGYYDVYVDDQFIGKAGNLSTAKTRAIRAAQGRISTKEETPAVDTEHDTAIELIDHIDKPDVHESEIATKIFGLDFIPGEHNEIEWQEVAKWVHAAIKNSRLLLVIRKPGTLDFLVIVDRKTIGKTSSANSAKLRAERYVGWVAHKEPKPEHIDEITTIKPVRDVVVLEPDDKPIGEIQYTIIGTVAVTDQNHKHRLDIIRNAIATLREYGIVTAEVETSIRKRETF